MYQTSEVCRPARTTTWQIVKVWQGFSYYPSRCACPANLGQRILGCEQGMLRSLNEVTVVALPCICQTTASASSVDEDVSSSKHESERTKLATSACHKHVGPRVRRPLSTEAAGKASTRRYVPIRIFFQDVETRAQPLPSSCGCDVAVMARMTGRA